MYTGESFDNEQEQEMATYLQENEYESVEAWALDSDYLLTNCCGWVDHDDNPVDIRVQLWHAIEAAKEIA